MSVGGLVPNWHTSSSTMALRALKAAQMDLPLARVPLHCEHQGAARMSISSKIFKSITKKAWTRVMDRVGGKVVSGMADTSADAPSATFEPKRNLYEQLQREKEAAAAAAETHDHDHDHGHSHDHSD